MEGEIQALIPTIVVEASNAQGDIEVAEVSVDGQTIRERLDGRPIALDPGAHVVIVRLPTGEKRQRKVVISEGERRRKVIFDFSPPKPSGPPQTEISASAAPLQVVRPTPVLTYALAGASVVSVGIAVGFGIRALDMRREARETCAPLCSPDVTRAVRERATVSDIAWGVAVGAAVSAALVYLYRPSHRVRRDQTGWAWGVDLGPQRGELRLGGGF